MEADKSKDFSKREGGQDPSHRSVGELAKSIEEKLEVLRGQYDSQLQGLRTELGNIRDRPPDDDTDRGGTGTLQEQYKQIQEKLGQGLAGEQKEQLETLMSDMDKNYQEKVTEMHEKHVDEVENQVKAMRVTLEEIYSGQLELARSELDQSHQVALIELRESLDKEHKEEMNRLEQEWNNKFEDLKQDFDRELRESKLEDSLGKEDSQEFISQLNKKLSEEHKQILKKIEEDLEQESVARGWSPRHPHRSHDTQTDPEADDTESVRSAPVTQEEFEHIEEREKVLGKAEDVRKTLDSQYEDIVALRTQMLGEYEQLLSVRTEVMASQTQEVEKLQQEMATIQHQYEEQMKTFQAKVEAQTEAALKSRLTEAHTKEVEELKQFYESKVSQMEEQLESLRQDAGGVPSSSEKERDYVRKTTMLTAISDTEETPPPSPPRGSDMYEVKIRSLEDKLKDRDKLIDELKKRLEAETASAEDLHGQLLDSNNKLCEFEDSLKARGEEIEELKAVLLMKDTKINTLENEKAEWEEKGEKEIEGKIIGELKLKIKKLEEELSTSKEAESRIRQELNQLNSQHQEAIIALKIEMENISKNKIIELESEFKIKLEQELDKQAKEIANKHIEELNKLKSELENIQKSETELKEELDSVESSHEKQLNELKEKYDRQLRDSLVTSTVTLNGRESAIEPELAAETKVVPKTAVRESGSPITSKKTYSEAELEKVDRDSIEASIRAEILLEYEQSIDKLKSEYEERISHLNTKLQSYETQGAQKISVIDSESVPSKVESSIREKLRIELAKEYKEKLQNVTEDYESKLKHLQAQIDTKTPVSVSLVSETRDTEVEPSSETVVRSPTEKTPGKIPKEYEGYVSTIRKDYEDKIVALQTEIAQYKTSAVPSPLSPKLKEPDSQTLVKEIKLTADAGLDIDPQTVKLRQEIRETVSAEYETAFENLKSDYEKQLKDLSHKVSSLQSESPDDSDIEMRVRTELTEEYDKKLTTLENQFESKIAELTQKLENAMGEKTTAEQKVKADMFVWHEEIVTQLKRKHEDNITQINKEYEEKMDLLREEMQEEFDAEREKMLRHHKQEIMDYEDRYENLLEGLRTGDAPDVAAIVQEKFDMELEMAKTLIQQECEETIESEQSRLSEQHEYEIEKLLAEKEEALEEQSAKFDKDMADLKNTLLKQYEDQIHEMEARYEEAMTKAKQEFETLVEKAKTEAKEGAESEKKPEVEADTKTVTEREDQEPESEESELVRQLKQELVDKEQEYTAKIEEMKAVHEEEISQLMKDLQDKDTECEEKIGELEEKHTAEIAEYQEKVEQLQQDIQKAGADTTGEDTEALELAHQQELQDLEDRLTDKHRKEKDNLETQFKSRLDDIEEKHSLEIERLKNELLQAQQALDQYPDIQEEVMSPVQAVPTFHAADSTLGSTREVSQDDFMVPTQTTSVESAPDSRSTSLKETEAFEAQSTELITEEKELSLQGTLDDTGLQSLETEQTPRGSLRGVDDTIESGELIHFSEEEEESDKSEGADTKTDRSTPTELMQTLGYGTVITGGPTVKSLDDTSESSVRVSDREDQSVRIRELEVEVEDLRKKLQHEMSKQDVQHDRLDREKQEESNLVAMLQVDIERLNNDREALQNTNEHLLGLLSDAVKTYMNIDDNISKKLKTMMEKPMDKSAESSGDRSGDKGRPRSAEGKRTPTRRSPQLSPSDRHSPAREEGADGDNIQNTSVVSNVTDEGLDLSQRISDSIFQGPDLASEEEELLQDSGSRLQTSVTKLLDMIDETTSQLLDTKQTQAELMETLDSRGQDLDRLTSRCNDLEERLREEVERKDFLALELHKAEGLIEGYSSERDQQDHKIQDLEEQKENLVLELETIKNKLMDMDSTQEENESLRKEIHDQQELITSNVGEEAQALMLEVTRLHSENREKEHQIKQVQERYESRVRELENSGEDMEGHYFKLLDEKKQEVVDLRMQVDALEKHMKAKKQFIEEQANEREQEHEDYQKEIDKWKKIVQDIEKHNGYESRLQTEVDDLTEQLQSRIELHNQAVLAADKYQSEIRDKELSITELKAIIQQLEAEIQDKIQEAEADKQKLQHLEQELSQRPYPDDELSEGTRSESADDKKTESPDYLASLSGQKQDRVGTQISVEDELRLAAEKTKEDVVREKHALQVQVNELLKQISGLRNQLDEMRHRTDFSDPSEATKRLQAEREKSEEKDKEISELKLQVESLGERVENREQQIQQLAGGREDVQDRTGGQEVDMRVKEMETQIQAVKAENKQLRERVQLAGETSSVTDISGLSQNLLEEKNQEIDHLSEQLMRVRTEFQELRAEKGVENMYDELESLREELKQKEREIEDIQSVKVSQAFTDHSITPEGSMMNVGASFSEKASIQQELEESEAQRLQKVASLEAELLALRTTLGAKEEEIVSLQEQIDSKRLGQEDASLLQEIIDEKEQLIIQLTEQTESLQVEMENLSDFQTKLQEDFDTVQVMLEDKEKEIEQLTKELTDKSPESTDEHAVVIKHEIEISRLKKQLREKDNVIEEKMEELAELSDKLETYEIDIQRLKDSESEKDGEVAELKKQLDNALSIRPPPVPMTEEEKDRVIAEKEELVEKLQQQVTTMLGRPPSPPKSEDEKSTIIQEQKEEIENLKQSLESALGRPPSPPLSEDEQRVLIKEQKVEIETLKQNLESLASEGDRSELVLKQQEEIKALKEELEAASLGRPPSPPLSEDQKMVIIKQQKLELDTMRKQVDAALLIKPPSPPRSDDEKSEIIYQQEQEISSLKKQVEAALQIPPPPPPMTEDEKGRVIEKKEEEIVVLRKELDKLGEAISSGGEERLLNEKVQEVVNLHRELTEVRDQLKYEQKTVKEVIEKKDEILKEKETECEKLCEDVVKLKEELQSIKEVKSYEDEIELKEKEDEIEQLQLELDSYRNREGSYVDHDQTELGESQDSKQLVRSMSFYKDQYEEKCSEARQLQVSLDIAKEKLEKIQKEQSADLTDEIELLKVEIEREKKKEIQELEEIKDTLEKEREEKDQEILDLKRELTLVKERTGVEAEVRLKDMEKEIEKAKDEAAHERRDSVQTLKDMEEFRERKEKERKDTLKTIQQLERDLEEKTDNEKKLNKQIKQLNEELTQYRGEEPKSLDSFEMGRDVQTLQKQVEAFKKQADRTKEVLAEKQKYQSQVIQLEIKYENLQKQMRKGVSDLEGQVKTFAAQPDQNVWEQLKITQERLDRTAEQLSETADKLNETEAKLSKVSSELASREEEISEVQQDLWKTSGLLSITSGKLQETEEKLRQSVAQVTEREEQIHQLQGELQDTEKVAKKASPRSPTQQQDIDKLKQQLSNKQTELEQVKQSLKEAVDMNEQQLQMTEQKDQEFVKLKLDIQQTIADKDKTIKEQKQKLKGIEHKEQEITSKERQIEKMKQEAQQALATKDRQIGKLREDAAQLQRQLQELRLRPDGAGGDNAEVIKQKVMDLKDELSSEHQRHIEDISARASQDAETQLAQMRIKYEDEIEQLRQLHGKEMDQKLRDQLNTLERKHKSETNKLVLRYQEQIELLKTRAGPDIDTTGMDLVGRLQDEVASTERLDRQQLGQRQDGVGQDRNIVNGHPQPTADGMSSKLQNLLRRLHSEGVQVLSISELQYLNRNLSPQNIPRDADIESLKAGWENERQSYLSTIQSLKDLLAQTHKLRGLDKDDDEEDLVDDWMASIEGSDWRAELLRAIGYVFSKEREALLAELRSHVLSHPDANLDDIQRLEQKIRNQEAHHHSAMDQIFAADRQSQLAEIRDLRAHATISRMHHQEERERLSEKLANAEDHGSKKERQLKRQVQLLEFKIQQEKVLQDDLRTSLDAERARSGTLSGQLNHEKSSNLDLQSNVSGLQVQVGKLKETLEREQSRFVSVTNALEEEKSKSLNLSELLESERQTLYRVQSEFEALRRAQESQPSIRHLEELQGELKNERERRCQADSRHEIDLVTMENLRQEVDMQKRHQQAIQKEYDAKTYQLQRMIDNQKQKVAELDSALEREHSLTLKLRQSLEAEKSQQETTGRERKLIEDLQIQLETERGKVHDLNNALQREHKNIEEVMSSADSEKRLLQEHLDQEREVNHHLKHDLDALQIEKLEVLSKYDKEHEQLDRLKAEKDQMNEELKNLRILEAQRDRDREAEKLADKKAVRQADREKEEYRMKLHEQELETQRLTQKSASLEDQIAELQDNELKAIRELEEEKLRNYQAEEEAREKEAQEATPRSDDGDGMTADGQAERQERWQVYRSQLESMCQSLHYLVLRCREQLSKSSHSGTSQSDVVDFDALHSSLRDLLNEVKQLQEIEGDFMSHPSGSVNERILRHNEELTNFVARSSKEKNELRNALSRLEEEIWRYRQKDQEVQRASSKADESLLKERAGWAKERLSLQMSLNTAEREIDQLQTDLRVERERRVAAGITDTKETDKVKIQRLYGKYLRAESFRKALIYQKKYLLLLLGGFQDTEETTLALLARMGATPAIESLHHRHLKLSPITTFRSAVRVVIAITRMKYLVRKWKRATRVGSEVVGGTVDQMNGYMPDSGSFSPPRHPSSPRFMPSASHALPSSSPRASYHYSPPRLPDPLIGSSRSQLEVDTVLPSSYPLSRGTYSQVHTTPPTKDYSSTTRYTSPSSGARRKILTTPQTQLAQPGRARFAPQEAVNGDYGSHDDYINRLENLQTRLGNLQNALTGLSGGSKMTLIAV